MQTAKMDAAPLQRHQQALRGYLARNAAIASLMAFDMESCGA